jgi:hypothetical protein
MLPPSRIQRRVVLCESTFRRKVSPSSGAKISRAQNQQNSAYTWCTLLARLIVYPEDGGDIFPQNVGSATDYTALYPRRW